MTPYTIYSLVTGAIIRVGTVRSQDAGIQTALGEGVIRGARGNAASQRVDITKTPPVLVSLS
jgi:hypothetical protein